MDRDAPYDKLLQNSEDGDEESLALPRASKRRLRTVQVCVALIFSAGALLLLVTLLLAIVDMRMLARLESVTDGLIDKTNRKYGFGAPLLDGGFSGEQFLATRISSSPTSKPTSTKKTSIQFPTSIDLINEEQPDSTYVGKRNVELTQHVSAIFQFRVGTQDLDMCTIGGFFPTFEELGNKSVTMMTTTIEIWKLSGSRFVEPWEMAIGASPPQANFTYNTRLPREVLLGEMRPKMGTKLETPQFSCPQPGDIWAYELACKGHSAACMLSLQQEVTRPILGFEMVLGLK